MAKSRDNLGIWWINSPKNYLLSIYYVLGIYMDSEPSLQNGFCPQLGELDYTIVQIKNL